MNHTYLCLPSGSWYSFTDPEGWKAELALLDYKHRLLAALRRRAWRSSLFYVAESAKSLCPGWSWM